MRDFHIRDLLLEDGARIAVIGGGPAGSFFSYFVLKFAKALGMDISVDIYESKNFNCAGPRGVTIVGESFQNP